MSDWTAKRIVLFLALSTVALAAWAVHVFFDWFGIFGCE